MADITPGYTFTSGERNVDHTKLNTLGAGTINTTFHTGKASAGSNPNTGSTEVMVYDTSAGNFKKGTLSSLFLDHTGLLSARSAKSVPITGDTFLLSDSAAAGAYKQITLGNLLFGAAAHGLPVASDLLAIYDTLNTSVKRISLGNLITLLVAHTAPVTADELMVREAGGAVRKMTLGNLINGATAATVPAAGQFIPIYDGAYKKVDLAVLISGLAASLTSPAGTELFQVNDAGVLKKLTTANLKAYVQSGVVTGYALYREDVTSGVDGGTFTNGGWRTRLLTTEVTDANNIGSIASNKVTLAAGTYRFRAEATARDCGQHRVRLFNVTTGLNILQGIAARSAGNNASLSVVSGRVVLAGSTEVRLEHYCTTTGTFGTAVGDGDTEVYSQLEIWKEG